jgi:ribosomal protein S18 acetylase RimI-like enzyme
MTNGLFDQSDATALRPGVRPLTGADLERCITIDRALSGRSRRGFFETRLDAALKDPERFIHVGVTDGDMLAGFALVRLLVGEYGAAAPFGVLDAIGVDRARQGNGFGHALMHDIENVMRGKGTAELRSQLDWNNTSLMQFLDLAGFRLAPRVVLSREVAEATDSPAHRAAHEDWRRSPTETPPKPPFEPTPRSDAGVPDYSGPHGDDIVLLSRDKVPVRSMIASDLPALIRIDRKITGRERSAYFESKVAEVLEESGIRISIVGELDGTAVGFIMARLDFGEFGHVDPEAVIDTIGVDPDFAHHHVGSALISQILVNLGALRVEHVRTQVGWDQLGLLSFLDHCRFRPSQRIALVRAVSI